MSAWLLSKNEIDVLVHWLHKTGISNALPDDLGKMLWSENYKSIRYRYGDYNREGKFLKRPAYHYSTPKPVQTRKGTFDPESPNEALAMAHCYDYQTCEHPSYDSSRAKRMIDKLEKVLVSQGATWGSGETHWGIH